MKPLLCAASVVRNLLNVEVGSWPAKAIDPAKAMQWQDRRPLSPQPTKSPNVGDWYWKHGYSSRMETFIQFAPTKVGDVFYVRENVWDYDKAITTKMIREGADTWPVCMYSADMTEADVEWCKEIGWKQRPSIHMPKALSRIHLEVMRVRVERACDISEDDAKAEGCETRFRYTEAQAEGGGECIVENRDSFETLWKSIYGPDAWQKWVWVTDLKRIK